MRSRSSRRLWSAPMATMSGRGVITSRTSVSEKRERASTSRAWFGSWMGGGGAWGADWGGGGGTGPDRVLRALGGPPLPQRGHEGAKGPRVGVKAGEQQEE